MDDALAQEDQQQTHGMEGAHLHDASGGEPWGLTWGGVMPNVSCLHPHRLMPYVPVCLNQRQHSAPFGGDLDTRGGHLECVCLTCFTTGKFSNKLPINSL
ncbi:hypothetical protein PAPYR_12899 [Paratrimastix pyriformis]|uniref:Uncharacterized protein n=1 Tax=Paratrimastix pyriformis TaxID=342808 RepID=A0ABQ8U5H1_9EUKA|nr:hypothetical protein PAPYR_12899 [Paratrimastix pyriformis]